MSSRDLSAISAGAVHVGTTHFCPCCGWEFKRRYVPIDIANRLQVERDEARAKLKEADHAV